MNLDDRKFLLTIKQHVSHGENLIVSDLINKRLTGLCHIARIEQIEQLIAQKQYDKAINDLDLCLEFNPNDEELNKLHVRALLMTCVE